MQAPRIRLRRRTAGRAAISIVPLIDVLLIMLVFFMVTSTYLDLDMIPLGEPAPEARGPASSDAPQASVFVRIASDGRIVAAGQRLDLDGFSAFLAERVANGSGVSLLVLPSARSTLQTLVAVMDRATLAGVDSLRVVRLSAP